MATSPVKLSNTQDKEAGDAQDNQAGKAQHSVLANASEAGDAHPDNDLEATPGPPKDTSISAMRRCLDALGQEKWQEPSLEVNHRMLISRALAWNATTPEPVAKPRHKARQKTLVRRHLLNLHYETSISPSDPDSQNSKMKRQFMDFCLKQLAKDDHRTLPGDDQQPLVDAVCQLWHQRAQPKAPDPGAKRRREVNRGTKHKENIAKKAKEKEERESAKKEACR